MTRSFKTLVLGTVAVAGALAGGAAHAHSDVYWSIDIRAPGHPVGVGVALGNAPRVVAYPAPVVVAPPPVVYGPPAVVYGPPAMVYAPRPVWVAPPRVIHAPPVYVYDRKPWKRAYAPPRRGPWHDGHHGRGR